jgi:predicted metal-dependent phosphoesterase TrpH
MKADLHTHTTYSDGTLDPEELILCAREQKITHLAIADHDSTGSLEIARAKASEFGMTVISGVEINTKDSISVHVLGYLIDEKDERLQKILSRHRELRENRARMILEKLNRMGIKILLSDFNHRKEGAAIGRPHIADKLKERGIVFSRQEAFDKFLAQGRPAYASYEGPTPKEAIDAILASKGVPVVAHPGYSVSNETIESLARMGLAGIEVYYPSHNPEQVGNFLQIAKRFNLIVTGGSDYHGPGSGHEKLGEVNVPEQTVEDLQQCKARLFG